MQVLVDEGAGLRRRQAHHALDNVCGQLLHHVDRIVEVHLLDKAGELSVGDRVEDALLVGRLEVGEDVRRHLLGEQAEDLPHRDVVQLGNEFGHVEFIHVLHPQPKAAAVVLFKQFLQFVEVALLDGFVVQALLDFFFFHAIHPHSAALRAALRGTASCSPNGCLSRCSAKPQSAAAKHMLRRAVRIHDSSSLFYHSPRRITRETLRCGHETRTTVPRPGVLLRLAKNQR